jgi:hypothetical protein
MDFKFDLEQTHTNDDDDDELLAELYGLVEEDVQKNRDVDKHHPKKYNTAKPNQGQAKGSQSLCVLCI